MNVAQLLGYPLQRLVDSKSCFHADSGEIERIGKRQTDSLLAGFDLSLQDEPRQDVSEQRKCNDQERRFDRQAGGEDEGQREQHAQDADAKEDGKMPVFPITSLHKESACL